MSTQERLQCRMYQREFPEVDEVVMVKVLNITDTAIYVELLEYDGLEGMVILKELQRRAHIRSMKRVITIGKVEPMMVLSVEPEKNYFDLSKKHVSVEDAKACQLRYQKSKQVHGMMSDIVRKSENQDLTLLNLYEQFGWPLEEQYGSLYDGFRHLNEQKEKEQIDLFPKSPIFDDNLKQIIVDILNEKMFQHLHKIETVIGINCHSVAGVNGIKEALKIGQDVNPEVSIKLVASPEWRLTLNTYDDIEGIKQLKEVLEKIGQEISKQGGQLTISTEPQVMMESISSNS